MGTAVQQYVAAKRGVQDEGAIRLTVRVGQQHYARLVQMSEKLRAAKTSLAGELLEAAITDAWKELGLPTQPYGEVTATGHEEGVAHLNAVRESKDGSSQSRDEGDVSVSGTWIFQANPKSYKVRKALDRVEEHDRTLTWLTTHFREEIRSGDRVYLWEAGPTGGLLAVTTVVAEPAIRADDEWEMQFALDRARFRVPDWRAVIRIDRRLQRPITRRELETHPILKTLTILRFAQATNFRVSPEQAEALADLVGDGAAA